MKVNTFDVNVQISPFIESLATYDSILSFILAPTTGPLNVQVSNTSATSLKVTWNPPLQNETHGRIRQYRIRYRKFDCSSSFIYLTTWTYINVGRTKGYAHIEGLTKWSCYGVQIRAMTIKNGKWSEEVRQRTSEHGNILFV